MRVWLQSATAAGHDPLWDGYRKAVEQHVAMLAAPASDFRLHGVPLMTPALEDFHYPEFLNTQQILEHAIAAEREGWDAFATTCLFDPGYHELRELVDIPVVAAGECSMHLACMLGDGFALISQNALLLHRMERLAERYGLRERLRPSVSFGASIVDLANALNGDGASRVLDRFHDAARRAVAGGVEVLVPACNVLNMLLRVHGVKDVEGAVVLDPYAVLIKHTEMMVDLRRKTGLGLSRRRHFARPDRGVIDEVRRVYGLPRA